MGTLLTQGTKYEIWRYGDRYALQQKNGVRIMSSNRLYKILQCIFIKNRYIIEEGAL